MPIPSQFRTQNELVQYLEDLEQRIETLEAENQALKEEQSASSEIDLLRQVNDLLDERFPKTKMFNFNFLTRAFTVWGHFFTAQLIILAGILVIILLIRIVILAGAQ